MTQFAVQDTTEEKGIPILLQALRNELFFVYPFSFKDKYPDIDGFIRLRDGKNFYLNKYLHFQLKSVETVKGNSYYFSRSIIDYLTSTNVPTIFFVVDVTTSTVYWIYITKKLIAQLELNKDKKGRTIQLSKILPTNNPETHRAWAVFAKQDNYKELQASLDKIISNYKDNVIRCVGLLYLLQRIDKTKLIAIFSKVLNIRAKEVELIIEDLEKEKIITSTENLYLIENDHIGINSLFDLLSVLNIKLIEQIFKTKEEKVLIFRQLAKIQFPTVDRYFKSVATELLDYISKIPNSDVTNVNLELLEEYAVRVPNEALRIVKAVISSTKIKVAKRKIKGYGVLEGKSHSQLIVKSLEILDSLRYLKPREALAILLSQSLSTDLAIKSKSLEVIKHLSTYNPHALKVIGYEQQTIILKVIAKFNKAKLIKYFDAVIEITKCFLEPTYEGTSMQDYQTISFHRGALPINDHIRLIRKGGLELLKSMYPIVEDVEKQKIVLQSIDDVSRTPSSSNYGSDMETMVLNDTNDVINFYISILPTANNLIIKEIDEHRHWFVRRFTESKLPKIEELDSLIASNSDYEMFRIFVGFDFRFSQDLDWKEAEEARTLKIQQFIDDINDLNKLEWSQKILSVIKHYSQSSAGEYQYFNRFLNSLAQQKPIFCIELIQNNEIELEPFITHIISGLWTSEEKELSKKLIDEWIADNKYLSEIAFIPSYTQTDEFELLEKVFKKAKTVKDQNALVNILRSISDNSSVHKNFISLFISTIKELTKYKNTNWVHQVWFRKWNVFKKLSSQDCDTVLLSLIHIKNIDFYSEHILIPIAKRFPEKIVNFFYDRMKIQAKSNRKENYDAIPYELGELAPVLYSKASVIVPMIIAWFREGGWRNRWEASHMLKSIFPNFESKLSGALIKIVTKKSKKNLEILFSMMSVYHGEENLKNLCLAFVNAYSTDKNYKMYRDHIFAYLSQTGVVSGENGFIRAYEAKIERLTQWKTSNKKLKIFIEEYRGYLQSEIEYQKKKVSEDIKLRQRGIR